MCAEEAASKIRREPRDALIKQVVLTRKELVDQLDAGNRDYKFLRTLLDRYEAFLSAADKLAP